MMTTANGHSAAGHMSNFSPQPPQFPTVRGQQRCEIRSFLYSVVQKNSSMFEFAAFLLPTNVGQPMHSPSALTEHVSLNLA